MKCFACGTEPTGEPWTCECGGTRLHPVTKSTTPRRAIRKVAPECSPLDCPHCGATPEALDKSKGTGVYVYDNAPSDGQATWPHVACLECGSGSPSIAVWNRRANKEVDRDE